jgi:cysteine desulfurase family protein
MNKIYLDNAATSFPKPDEVYDFMESFYRKPRFGSAGMAETKALVNDTRQLLTQLFHGGSDYNRLTFSSNATDSLNLIINGLVEPGIHVVTTLLEHNAVLRPLYMHEQAGTIGVTYVPFDLQTGFIDQKAVEEAIRPHTKFLVMSQCSNVLGTVQPIAEVGAICKKHGVIFVVDGSQGAGYNEVDMQACHIDCYVFTGHKALMGPTGIGGSYVREGITIKHTRAGGTGFRSESPAHLEEYPYRLEYGTPNILGIAGLNAGVKWVVKQGIPHLHRQKMELWEQLRLGIKEIKGATIYCAGSGENRNPVLSFNIAGYDAPEVNAILDAEYDIAARAGLQCAPKVHECLGTLRKGGVLRMSIGAFTTAAEVDAAVSAIRKIAALKN